MRHVKGGKGEDDAGEKSGELLKRGIFIPLWQFAWSFEDERNYVASMQAA